jgi:hypothetical protein
VDVVGGGGDGGERRGRTVPVGGENGEKKGFSAAVTVGRGFGGGRTGCRRRCRYRWVSLEGELVWGGNFWRGEMKCQTHVLFVFFFQKNKKGSRHDYFSITKVVGVSLLYCSTLSNN